MSPRPDDLFTLEELEQFTTGGGAPGIEDLTLADLESMGSPPATPPPAALTPEELDRGTGWERFKRGVIDRPFNAMDEIAMLSEDSSELATDAWKYARGLTDTSKEQYLADAKADRDLVQRSMMEQLPEREGPGMYDVVPDEWDVLGGVGEIVPAVAASVFPGTRSKMAQTGIAALDSALMPLETTRAENFDRGKYVQTALGTGLGAVGEMIPRGLPSAVLSKSKEMINRLRPDTDANTSELLSGLFPKTADAQQAADLLRAEDVLAPGLTPASEILAGIKSPALHRVAQSVDVLTPETQATTAANEVARNQTRQAMLTEEAVKLEPAKLDRKTATDPTRETALTEGLAAQQEVRALNKSVAAAEARVADQPVQDPLTRAYEGDPRFTPDDAATPEALAARQDLDAAIRKRIAGSAKPITPEKLATALDEFAIANSDRIGAGAADAVTTLRNRLLSLDPKNKGYVDPASLYVIRKQIQSNKFKFVSPNTSSDVAIDLELKSDLVDFLDKTIADSLEEGSPLWKDYLNTYAEMSVPVNQARFFRELEDVASTDNMPGAFNSRGFSSAVGSNVEKTADNAGVRLPDADLSKLLDPDQQAIISRIDADIGLSNEAKRLAGFSRETIEGVGQVEPLKLGNALIREIMIANAAGKYIGNKATEAVIARVTTLFTRDPEKGFEALAAELEKIGASAADPTNVKLMQALNGLKTVLYGAGRLGEDAARTAARQGSATAAGSNFQ